MSNKSDNPKDPKEPVSTGADDTLFHFPMAFPIKAMGKMKSDNPEYTESGFAQTILDIILKHAPDFDARSMEMRPSKNGTYISVTATINAQSRLQLDDIYRELSAHPLVLMAL